jgi:hypothetical protein
MKTRGKRPKLSLNRETLRQLEDPDLAKVVGGITVATCPPTTPRTCDTCNRTCSCNTRCL